MPFDTRPNVMPPQSLPAPPVPAPAVRPEADGTPSRGRAVLFPVLALAAAVVLGAVAGALPAAGPAGADPDLARLMKAMAILKAAMAAGLIALIGWRLTMPAGAARLALYLAATGAMAAGVALMWRMTALGPAAIALHAGLVGAILLLLRDRTIIGRIDAAIARRRATAQTAKIDEAGTAYADDHR